MVYEILSSLDVEHDLIKFKLGLCAAQQCLVSRPFVKRILRCYEGITAILPLSLNERPRCQASFFLVLTLHFDLSSRRGRVCDPRVNLPLSIRIQSLEHEDIASGHDHRRCQGISKPRHCLPHFVRRFNTKDFARCFQLASIPQAFQPVVYRLNTSRGRGYENPGRDENRIRFLAQVDRGGLQSAIFMSPSFMCSASTFMTAKLPWFEGSAPSCTFHR